MLAGISFERSSPADSRRMDRKRERKKEKKGKKDRKRSSSSSDSERNCDSGANTSSRPKQRGQAEEVALPGTLLASSPGDGSARSSFSGKGSSVSDCSSTSPVGVATPAVTALHQQGRDAFRELLSGGKSSNSMLPASPVSSAVEEGKPESSVRELNPYFKDGGTGLPPEKVSEDH